MKDPFRRMVEHLLNVVDGISDVSEKAAKKMEGVNELLARLGASGCLPQTVILGPVVLQRDYPPPRGIWAPGEVLQACLLVPQGIGVAVWDAEFYLTQSDSAEGLQQEVPPIFVPFEDCETAVKALLLPHLDGLLARLFRKLPRPISRNERPADDNGRLA